MKNGLQITPFWQFDASIKQRQDMRQAGEKWIADRVSVQCNPS
jgi:hypothetical protein